MKRLIRPLLTATIVLFAVQCQDRQSPVAVEGFDQLEPSATQSEIEAMIAALFKTGHKTAATKRFQNAVRHLNKGKTALAQETILELIAWTLQRNAAGQLQNPNGNAPPTKNEALAELINAWLEFFGLAGDSIPPEAFEEDGDVEVCGPGGCTLQTGTKFAGAVFPPGALSTTVVAFVHRIPEPPGFPSTPGPLFTDLAQYPLFYFFGTNPEVGQFNIDIDVALCVLDDPPWDGIGAPEGAELRIAHNVSENPEDGIEIFPLAAPPPGLLDCTDAAPVETESEFGARLMDRFAATLVGPFSPNLLYAMPGELGSKASNFSPFGAVDIEGDGPVETTTTLDAEPDTVLAGDQFTLTATVDPPPAGEEAEVEFFVYGEGLSSLGTASVNGFGVAELVVDTACFCESANCFEPGTWTFVAEFLGTETHAASTSNDKEVLVDETPCTA